MGIDGRSTAEVDAPIEDSAIDNCGNTEWLAVGETGMLRVPEGGIHALA